jgi:hypothetical protein
LGAIGKKETKFAEQFLLRETEERAYARVLQRGHREAASSENGREPTRRARAEGAVGVEKQEPVGMAAFAVGVIIGKGEHGASLSSIAAVGAHGRNRNALIQLSFCRRQGS